MASERFPGKSPSNFVRYKKNQLLCLLTILVVLPPGNSTTSDNSTASTFAHKTRSSSEFRPYFALEKRPHKKISVENLSEWERVSFLRTYLKFHSKKLSEKQEFKLAAADQLALPLFGKVIF